MQNVPPVIVIKGNELFIHFQERGGTNTISFVDKRFKGSFLTHSTGTKQQALVSSSLFASFATPVHSAYDSLFGDWRVCNPESDILQPA